MIGRHFQEVDGRFRCEVCPRRCTMRPGQRGFCYVRGAHDDGVHLETWGRSSGFCIDPIEKKPLNHFLPGTPVLSFGTAGCNLGCRFCQNWDISKARADDRLMDEAATPERIARTALAHQCNSVAFTYNDPVIFLEYAIDVAMACHAQGVRTVGVTAGYIEPAPRTELFAHLDAANIDLKAFTETFYGKLCLAELGPVLDTLDYVANETDCWLEVTTLLIPGENDSNSEIEALSAWMVAHLGPGVPLHFTAFHPDYKLLDSPRTPIDTLRRARAIALEAGLAHVYTGNVRDPEGGATTCEGCGVRLIVRDGYELRTYRITADGRCDACSALVPGVWDIDGPGSWGNQRRPVRLET